MHLRLAAMLTLSVTASALAQTPQRTRQDCQPRAQAAGTQTPGPSARAREYDVVVDVPDLCVNSIELKVTNLTAHLALNAAVANLLQIDAGADVSIASVDLGVYGVRATALLLVDLDNVVYAIDRTLQFVDANPQVVRGVLRTVQRTVGTVGGIANTALQPGGVLSQTVNTVGQTVQRLVDNTGAILEQTLDTTGRVVGSRTVGNVLSLPVLQQTTNAAGQVVKQVRDVSGRLIEYTLDAAGKVVSARVLSGGR